MFHTVLKQHVYICTNMCIYIYVYIYIGQIYFVGKDWPIQVLVTSAGNSCMQALYRGGVWIHAQEALRIAALGQQFLVGYGKLAKGTFEKGLRRYVLIPKLHFFHHLMTDLREQGSAHRWALNPLIYSVQMQEDYIGKPSRVSRKVSAKLHSQRTVERVLFAMFAEYQRVEGKV